MESKKQPNNLHRVCNLVEYKIQLILIIYWFHIHEFAFLLKCIYNPKINTCNAFEVFHRPAQSSKKFESPDMHFPSWVWIKHHAAFLLSSFILYKSIFFVVCLVPKFFCIFVLFVGEFTVLNGPKHRAEVLSRVPCLTRKTDKLPLGWSYSAVAKRSMLTNQQYILNKVSLMKHL